MDMRMRHVLIATLLLSTTAGVAQAGGWVQLGPAGGPVAELTSQATTPKAIYAGGAGGVWKSTDTAATWAFLPKSPAPVTHVAVSPLDPALVFAGNDDRLWRSTDGGATWIRTLRWNPGPSMRRLSSIAWHPTDSRVAIVTLFTSDETIPQMYRTTDGGKTWRVLAPPDTVGIIQELRYDPFIPRILYLVGLGNGSSAWVSTDDGAHWKSLATNTWGTTLIIGVRPIPDVQGMVYAFNHYGSPVFPSVFRSLDHGTAWGSVGLADGALTDVVSHQCLAQAVLASTRKTGIGVWQGFRNTNSWSKANIGLGNGYDGLGASIGTMNLSCPYGLVTTAAGIWRTVNVGTPIISWEAVNLGLRNSVVGALRFAKGTHTLYAGVYGAGVYKNTTGGVGWNFRKAGVPKVAAGEAPLDVTDVAVEWLNTAKVYMATNHGLLRSVDAGGNWALASSFTTRPISIAVDPQNPSFVRALDEAGDLWVSGDAGGGWANTQTDKSCGCVGTRIAVGPTTYPIYSAGEHGIARLASLGAAWVKRGLQAQSCSVVVVHPKTPTTLYAGCEAGPFKSTDAGLHWSTVNPTVFSGRPVGAITVDPANGDVYVGFRNAAKWVKSADGKDLYHPSGGVWVSRDAGKTWTDLALPADRSVRALAVDPLNSRLFAGTDGMGVMKYVP